MDVAYDHIQEEIFPDDEEGKPHDNTSPQPSLNSEFRDAYQAFSKSPWGARLGGLWGTVKKQSEHYYEEAQREYTAASSSASKGFADLLNRTRSLSASQQNPEHAIVRDDGTAPSTSEPPPEGSHEPRDAVDDIASAADSRPESLPADIVKEAESMLSRFRIEAAKRLQDIQKAEDAADEALLRFGTNIRNFFKDAVTIAPPTDEEIDSGTSKVLFESKDSEGKRVIHTTRFDAQLHVIHCSVDSFLKDPASAEYEPWAEGFDVEKHTDQIGKDLEKYVELRRAMEKCVPERVDYATFWKRYYFLRHVVEEEERRRKELLRGAASNVEVSAIAWDEDTEDEDSATPHPAASSTTTLTQPKPAAASDQPVSDGKQKLAVDSLRPAEPRKSNDQHSQPDSDASYDLVSGASSRAPGSPKGVTTVEESDEEDWE